MNRRRSAAIGTFAMVLISSPLTSAASAAPVAPAQAPSTSALTANATAGAGEVTAAMRSEIDRVVAAGQTSTARRSVTAGPAALVSSQVRCAAFEGQRYCLGTGWTEESEAEVVADATASTRAATVSAPETTGDLTLADELRQRAALSPARRAAADRRELLAAARSVAKVWLLRHQIQGEPLPAGFVGRHPEITTTSPSARTTSTTTTTTSTVKPASAYPQRFKMLNEKYVAEQIRSYWCGPGSMQMIAWNWRGYRNTQQYWATKLGTTTSGSSISEMVRMTNAYTGWDNTNRAGKYVVLDIGGYSYQQWWLLQLRHLYDYRAPVILHPILLKKWYPYLDDDASGHFQVGRGYDQNGSGGDLVKYFEPWNQQRFDPSEPYISRTQTRSAYRQYRANREHSMHNIGV